MTRAATPENEDVLLNIARYGTANHVEKLVRYYRRYQRFEKLEAENVRFAQRRISLRQDDDDSWLINGRLTAEQGALLQKALDLGVEQRFQEQQDVPEEVEEEEEHRHPLDQPFSDTYPARRSDALARMAEVFLASTHSQASGGDAHHIHHWADGGETKMDNLVLLCRRHHRLVHEEGYGIRTGAFGEVTFTLPDGRVLLNNQHGRFRGNVIELKSRNRKNGLEIDHHTAVPELDDGHLDYGMAMDGLVQREGPLIDEELIEDLREFGMSPHHAG